MNKALTIIVIIAVMLAVVGLTACGFVEVHDIPLHFVVDGAAFADMSVSAYAANGLDVGTKDGYRFEGWYEDMDYTTAVNPALVTKESTLYGHWVKRVPKKTMYTVTFVLEDGTFVGQVQAGALADISYPAAPELEGCVFAEWTGKPAELTENITLVAKYWQLFEVTFVDEDGNTLASEQIKAGDYATPPVPPVKESTAQYHYEFAGWTSEDGNYNKVQCDMTVRATYRAVVNKYTYTLHLDNGQADQVRTVDYGTQITLPTPTKEPQQDIAYTFAGWDTDGDGAANDVKTRFRLYADLEAWAVYTTATRTFIVVFDVEGVRTQQIVSYGQSAVYPEATPVKPATKQYSYTFAGWDTDEDGEADDGCTAIYDDLVAVAVFPYTVNHYGYVFEDVAGNIYAQAADVPYGTPVPRPDIVPTMEDTDSATFQFAYWQDYTDDMPLTDDMRFVAVFSVNVRLYSVVFRINGESVATYHVPYNTIIDYDEAYKPYPFPVPEDGGKYAYEWQNWTPDYRVTRDDIHFNLVKTANFDYTVTWQIDEERSILTYYRQDAVLALPAPPTREGYLFEGWAEYSADIRVHEDMTMVAQWRAIEGE